MPSPEIRVTGEAFEVYPAPEPPMSLEDPLVSLLHSVAHNHRPGWLLNPSVVEIIPTVTLEEDSVLFILRGWHETEAPHGQRGVTHALDTSFELLDDFTVGGSLIRNEDQITYPIDPDSDAFLFKIAVQAIHYYFEDDK